MISRAVRLKKGDNAMWVTKYLYGESPKTAFTEYPDRLVIRSKFTNNIMPLLLICLLTFPFVLSIPHISETHFIIYLAIVIPVVCTYAKTIIIDQNTKTISILWGTLGIKSNKTLSLSELESVKIETVKESVRGSRLSKLIDKQILALCLKDGKKLTIEKSSDLDYLGSLAESIRRMCNQTSGSTGSLRAP